ncbi:MAG: hypothetical protein HY291_21635 [Planctomycetes bacterium]|nr:hypothetical protein [Planctomycetota bacterium]
MAFKRHDAAEKQLAQGLSPGARYTIGAVAAFFSVYMVFMASETKVPIAALAFAAFCAVLATACFTTGKIRNIACRIMGGVIFAAGVVYLISQLFEGEVVAGKSHPSILNAIFFLAFFGIPGICYAIRGKFPGLPGPDG